MIVSLLASLALSFTMVPVLFLYLMRGAQRGGGAPAGSAVHGADAAAHTAAPAGAHVHPLMRVHLAFESGFQRFREAYRNAVAWTLSQARITVLVFTGIMVISLLLFPLLGRDFFPDVDAGEMRLHVRAPPGTRIESTQQYFAQVEAAIRGLVGNGQISVILDNIGLPYSGINIALAIRPPSGRWTARSSSRCRSGTPRPRSSPRCCAASCRSAFPAAAVLLPARRHRRPGAELRPARADRHPRHRLRHLEHLCARASA